MEKALIEELKTHICTESTEHDRQLEHCQNLKISAFSVCSVGQTFFNPKYRNGTCFSSYKLSPV